MALLAWPGGGSGLDVVAQARAALTPSDDEIVHLVITTRSATPGGRQGPQTSEQWSAANPTRWRSVGEATGIFVGLGKRLDSDTQPVTDRVEQAYRPGEFRSYSTRSNTLSVLLGAAADDRSRVPSVPGLGDGDPVSELAGMLSSGQLKDAGTVRSEGRTVRRLVARPQARKMARRGASSSMSIPRRSPRSRARRRSTWAAPDGPPRVSV